MSLFRNICCIFTTGAVIKHNWVRLRTDLGESWVNWVHIINNSYTLSPFNALAQLHTWCIYIVSQMQPFFIFYMKNTCLNSHCWFLRTFAVLLYLIKKLISHKNFYDIKGLRPWLTFLCTTYVPVLYNTFILSYIEDKTWYNSKLIRNWNFFTGISRNLLGTLSAQANWKSDTHINGC